MSRWKNGFPPSSRKKPAPEHGIRIKKAGTTWWGKRWIEALEHVLRGDSGRLARGKTYARAGRTHDLSVRAPLHHHVWSTAIAGMAAKAQFAAELLAGQMPEQIDEVFLAASVSLFPRQRNELKTKCSCPDWGDPCKHVAATHYVLGEALDRDPFLLFELRGQSKDQVLEALRAARSGDAAADSRPAPEPAGVTLGELSAEDYDKPPEPLPALALSFESPASHGAVLRQLGAPAAWGDQPNSPADMLAPLVQAAAEAARKIAMAEPRAAEEAPQPRAASERASERRKRRAKRP